MLALQLHLWPTFYPATKPVFFFKKNLNFNRQRASSKAILFFGNTHRNAHIGAGACVPGSVVRHHQLSKHFEAVEDKKPKNRPVSVKHDDGYAMLLNLAQVHPRRTLPFRSVSMHADWNT